MKHKLIRIAIGVPEAAFDACAGDLERRSVERFTLRLKEPRESGFGLLDEGGEAAQT